MVYNEKLDSPPSLQCCDYNRYFFSDFFSKREMIVECAFVTIEDTEGGLVCQGDSDNINYFKNRLTDSAGVIQNRKT
jgi:hypothetical protein